MILLIILRIIGAICLLAGAAPFAVYGILNTGTVAIFLLGVLLVMLPYLWKRLQSKPKIRLVIGIITGIGLLFCISVSALMVWAGWFNPPPTEGQTAVIVLGSKINGDKPSLMLQRRLDKAAEYLQSNTDAICVVSGGQGADEDYPEAVVMEKYLISRGVDKERILVEQQSTNTRQNIRLSCEMLDSNIDNIVIATDGFHQLRAQVFAKSEGINSTGIPSLTPWGLLPSYWIREILGVSWAWVSTQLNLI